ncbi:MAG: HNH endonuclease, partial [Bdellovibrionales bacterium]|nr:HNH endonuclease [Bdellovibrionales bacterium]
SRYALEIDHRVPRAHGGTSTPENLRLLCRSCNQRAAIQAFGLRKMEPHLIGRP